MLYRLACVMGMQIETEVRGDFISATRGQVDLDSLVRLLKS
jgi:hypothetical protein